MDEHTIDTTPLPSTKADYVRDLRRMGYKAEMSMDFEELKRVHMRAVNINDTNHQYLRRFE